MGKLGGRFRRFPPLLKFLDAREMLSVQVHPADTRTDLLPAGETGKIEESGGNVSEGAPPGVEIRPEATPRQCARRDMNSEQELSTRDERSTTLARIADRGPCVPWIAM